MAKIADQAELVLMGREVASAMLKGADGTKPLEPTNRVPLVTLMFVANEHRITTMTELEFSNLAQAMEDALEEAERWNETDAQADNASKGG